MSLALADSSPLNYQGEVLNLYFLPCKIDIVTHASLCHQEISGLKKRISFHLGQLLVFQGPWESSPSRPALAPQTNPMCLFGTARHQGPREKKVRSLPTHPQLGSKTYHKHCHTSMAKSAWVHGSADYRAATSAWCIREGSKEEVPLHTGKLLWVKPQASQGGRVKGRIMPAPKTSTP